MSILAAIRDHSGRIYRAVQIALVVSVTATAYSLFWLDRPASVGWAATLSFAATLAALAGVLYVHRSIVFRLQMATIAEQERVQLLERDALTGAYSRRRFLEILQESIGSILKPNDATLMLLDLDYFKQLNDGLGHPFGDLALRDLVEKAARVFPEAHIGRLGGDEFAILLPGGDTRAAEERAWQLIDLLKDGRLFEGNRIPLSASIGIAASPVHAVQAGELMIVADVALYESKTAGRGRVSLFAQSMLTGKQHQRFVERELRAAIYLNELELHYQPITNADGSIFGHEALVRWRHSARGYVRPAEFIPIAERSSLIDLVGAWVFRRACHDLPQFDGGLISVNVSAAQLARDEVVDSFRRILAETGCDASRFIIEITETAATAATPEVIARLCALRKIGFQIALDDFGTGHCGFNYLQTLPINLIKIDGSYIRNLGHDAVAKVFVSALTQIARIQNITTVAEGIETEADLALAQAAGCTHFQGYHLGRPAALPRLPRAPVAIQEQERLTA